MVRHKDTFWALKIKYHSQMFVLGAFFENVFSPKGWQKNSRNSKDPKNLDIIDFPMV